MKKKKKKNTILKLAFFLITPFLFFLLSLYTLSDYGMNWDSPLHFARGQAFFRYFVTGKKDYKDAAKFCYNERNLISIRDYKTGEICDKSRSVRVSEYESTSLDFKWAQAAGYGHPPVSDILMTITNYVFYKKLGWLEDIEAYHIYNVLSTFLLAVVISLWMGKTFGKFASIVSVVALYSYPLLFAESHFNVKDPAMAAFFTLSIYLFWKSLSENKARYMIFSAIAGGISFGTKFNFVFAPFILFPWFLLFILPKVREFLSYLQQRSDKKIKKFIFNIPLRFVIVLLLYPLIIYFIFYISWPSIWPDPISNTLRVVGYYKDVGGAGCQYDFLSIHWIFSCSNTLPIQYFLTTLPIVSLVYFFIGFIASLFYLKRYNYVVILWISFFLVTILRVTVPISSTYGGIRQIMEFVGPFALLCGMGALFLRGVIMLAMFRFNPKLKQYKEKISFVTGAFLLMLYIPIFVTISSLHPNENVYFNEFLGGIKGAAEKNFPGYGNSYGNVYIQAVRWLNKNAEKNARIALIAGNAQNISRASLREDFFLDNNYASSYQQKGEYLIMLMTQGIPGYNSISYHFVNKFLDPVYVIEVDDVPLLKIWKNEEKYLKKGVNIKKERKEDVRVSYEENVITAELAEIRSLKRLEVNFDNDLCRQVFLEAPIEVAKEKDQFVLMHDAITNLTDNEIQGYDADLSFLFTGEEGRYIRIKPQFTNECDPSSPIEINVYSFPNK